MERKEEIKAAIRNYKYFGLGNLDDIMGLIESYSNYEYNRGIADATSETGIDSWGKTLTELEIKPTI